jgi:hypothetical protein
MIKESLSDLEAHILVFEPGDSRAIGRRSQEQPSADQVLALAKLGFHPLEAPAAGTSASTLAGAYVKGELALATTPWLALLPSKMPGDRELAALEAISREMARRKDPITLALLHTSRASEEIARLFLKHSVSVVLILPFGPLTRKRVGLSSTERRGERFAMVSIARPDATWSRPLFAQSIEVLRGNATSALVSDPEPEWITSRAGLSWKSRPLFYVRYDLLPDDIRRRLDELGARPLGRRADTTEPNLEALFGSLPEKPTDHVGDQQRVEGFQFPLAAGSELVLRELAKIIEGVQSPAGMVNITIPGEPSTEHLRAQLQRLLAPTQK